MRADDTNNRPRPLPRPTNPPDGPPKSARSESTSFTTLTAREQLRVVEIFRGPFREALAEVIAERETAGVVRAA